MKITRTSPFSGEENTLDINVTQEQLDAWKGGTSIQVAMSNVPEDEREFIKTGITSEEWDRMLGE